MGIKDLRKAARDSRGSVRMSQLGDDMDIDLIDVLEEELSKDDVVDDFELQDAADGIIQDRLPADISGVADDMLMQQPSEVQDMLTEERLYEDPDEMLGQLPPDIQDGLDRLMMSGDAPGIVRVAMGIDDVLPDLADVLDAFVGKLGRGFGGFGPGLGLGRGMGRGIGLGLGPGFGPGRGLGPGLLGPASDCPRFEVLEISDEDFEDTEDDSEEEPPEVDPGPFFEDEGIDEDDVEEEVLDEEDVEEIEGDDTPEEDAEEEGWADAEEIESSRVVGELFRLAYVAQDRGHEDLAGRAYGLIREAQGDDFEFLTGDDYPHLSPEEQQAINDMVTYFTEGGPDTDDPEAPMMKAYDMGLIDRDRGSVPMADQIEVNPFESTRMLDPDVGIKIWEAFGPGTVVYESIGPYDLDADLWDYQRAGIDDPELETGDTLADWIEHRLNIEDMALERMGVFGEEKARAIGEIANRLSDLLGIEAVRNERGDWEILREASNSSIFVKLAQQPLFRDETDEPTELEKMLENLRRRNKERWHRDQGAAKRLQMALMGLDSEDDVASLIRALREMAGDEEPVVEDDDEVLMPHEMVEREASSKFRVLRLAEGTDKFEWVRPWAEENPDFEPVHFDDEGNAICEKDGELFVVRRGGGDPLMSREQDLGKITDKGVPNAALMFGRDLPEEVDTMIGKPADSVFDLLGKEAQLDEPFGDQFDDMALVHSIGDSKRQDLLAPLFDDEEKDGFEIDEGPEDLDFDSVDPWDGFTHIDAAKLKPELKLLKGPDGGLYVGLKGDEPVSIETDGGKMMFERYFPNRARKMGMGNFDIPEPRGSIFDSPRDASAGSVWAEFGKFAQLGIGDDFEDISPGKDDSALSNLEDSESATTIGGPHKLVIREVTRQGPTPVEEFHGNWYDEGEPTDEWDISVEPDKWDIEEGKTAVDLTVEKLYELGATEFGGSNTFRNPDAVVGLGDGSATTTEVTLVGFTPEEVDEVAMKLEGRYASRNSKFVRLGQLDWENKPWTDRLPPEGFVEAGESPFGSDLRLLKDVNDPNEGLHIWRRNQGGGDEPISIESDEGKSIYDEQFPLLADPIPGVPPHIPPQWENLKFEDVDWHELWEYGLGGENTWEMMQNMSSDEVDEFLRIVFDDFKDGMIQFPEQNVGEMWDVAISNTLGKLMGAAVDRYDLKHHDPQGEYYRASRNSKFVRLAQEDVFEPMPPYSSWSPEEEAEGSGQVGSQIWETPDEAGDEIIYQDPEILILREGHTGNLALYGRGDDHAGYTIRANGMGYEFVRGIDDKEAVNLIELGRMRFSDGMSGEDI